MTTRLQLLIWGLKATWLLFVFAYGACLGSLTNVIVYRMPLGLSIVRPPSRCPKCETRLSWRDNIPVLGWLLLRGKCRYCRNPISPEYPIVEAAVGLLFVLFYAIWYMLPPHALLFGIDWGAIRPVWASNDAMRTWPEFVVLLALVASLFAMTLVDAKTFTIPIALTWVPALVALAIQPLHAVWLSYSHGPRVIAAQGWSWFIPTPGPARWDWVGLSIGGILGIGIAQLFLKLGWIRRSFADYAEWEAKAKAEAVVHTPAPAGEPSFAPTPPDAAALPPVEIAAAPGPAAPLESPIAQAATVTAPPESPASEPQDPAGSTTPASSESSPEMWMAYPYARREMVLELIFLAPCLFLMLVGWYAGRYWGGVNLNLWNGVYNANWEVPLWLRVLSGVFMGYLIGGGLVWLVRIAGSFAFAKEAMGMGDVHLMAGVGAALGWIHSTLAFFGAAFVGLAWAILGRILGGRFQRMMPYGPFLAVATVLVVLCKPLIERGLTALTKTPIHIPP